jgi:hypothetical protein
MVAAATPRGMRAGDVVEVCTARNPYLPIRARIGLVPGTNELCAFFAADAVYVRLDSCTRVTLLRCLS